MKNSPYKGKDLNFNEIWHLIQMLKFYYEDIMLLTPKSIADIIKVEFDCTIQENDVSLNLLLAHRRDSHGNLKCYE